MQLKAGLYSVAFYWADFCGGTVEGFRCGLAADRELIELAELAAMSILALQQHLFARGCRHSCPSNHSPCTYQSNLFSTRPRIFGDWTSLGAVSTKLL